MHEPITVEVGGDYGDGAYRYETVRFTGRLVDVWEENSTIISLYEWLDRGYLVYEEHDYYGRTPRRILHPWPDTKAAPSKGYTAEEIARKYPGFANAVGIVLERDIDFE